ncbi:MAG: hypothetical protein M0042_00380 [Nitrospiraceae bacterium]|nr:hypothetical protein [Nitrospiraceae bacterium]
MKRFAALLLAGLIAVSAASAQNAAAPAPDRKATPASSSGDDFITLNFNNIDISALVKVMSEFTRKNFILDERVTGKVTLMTPTKISPDEAYQVFLSALEIKGFTAVEDGKIIRIVPTVLAKQSGLKVLEDGEMQGQGFVTKLIRMSYVNPQDIQKTLTPLITKDGTIIAYPPTNSLIITDAVYAIRKIEQLVAALDVPAPPGKGKINVYYLKNAAAEDIAKVMQALVSRLPVPATGAAAPAAGPATILEGAVTITADKLTNSLIIVASPIDYETVRNVIDKLDIRRRQVYVEAAIIEMSLAKQRDLGFEFQMPIKTDALAENASSITGVGGTNFGNIGNAIAGGPAALASMNGLAVGAVKGTFTFKGQQFLSIGALLHALQVDGDVNVLSTPNILTMDNQKAEIMVGQNVPFLTGQTQNAVTGTGTLFNTIERKDVGIKLTLTPQISSDDNVRLEVNQEISDVIGSTTASSAGPTTSKRQASTTVVVKDRQTMVIGGLIRDNEVSTTSKVPLLGDIPLLGWLFKTKTTRLEKTNLMIFITPYIIKNENDAGELAQKKNQALEDFRKEYRIEKKKIEPSVIPAPKSAPSVTAPVKPAEPAELRSSEKPAELAPEGTKPAETKSGETVVTPAAPTELPSQQPAPQTAPAEKPQPPAEGKP